RYDRVRVAVRAQLPSNANKIQTLVAVVPEPGVQGPTIQLPIRVGERRGLRPASVVAAILSLGLLVAVSLVSAVELRVVLLGAGLWLAFFLQWYARPIASLASPAPSGVAPPAAPPTVIVEPSHPHQHPTINAQ